MSDIDAVNARIIAAFKSASDGTNKALVDNMLKNADNNPLYRPDKPTPVYAPPPLAAAPDNNLTADQLKLLRDYENKVLTEYEKKSVELVFVPQFSALFKGLTTRDASKLIESNPTRAWSMLRDMNIVGGTYVDFIKGKDVAGHDPLIENGFAKLVGGVNGSIDNLGQTAANIAQTTEKLTKTLENITNPDNSNYLLLAGVGAAILAAYIVLK